MCEKKFVWVEHPFSSPLSPPFSFLISLSLVLTGKGPALEVFLRTGCDGDNSMSGTLLAPTLPHTHTHVHAHTHMHTHALFHTPVHTHMHARTFTLGKWCKREMKEDVCTHVFASRTRTHTLSTLALTHTSHTRTHFFIAAKVSHVVRTRSVRLESAGEKIWRLFAARTSVARDAAARQHRAQRPRMRREATFERRCLSTEIKLWCFLPPSLFWSRERQTDNWF